MPPPSIGLDRVERLLEALVATGTVSAAVALIGGPRRIEWSLAAGWARGGPPAGQAAGQPAETSTWFDLASLTKPFVATLALALDRTRELPLATRVGELFSGAHPLLAARPLGDLLRHRAGLRAWTPLYARCRSPAEVEALLLSGELLGARPGTYSDLDYLLWGLAAQRALGRPLAALLGERVLAPFGLGDSVAAAPGDRPRVAESLMGTGREVELAARQGLVLAPLPPPPAGLPQDGNARFLAPRIAGALPGHAGLFGPAAALWRLGAEWLAPGRLLEKRAVAAALAAGEGPGGPGRPAGSAGTGRFALGWWRRRHRGAGGPALSPRAFGHTGFAGGSLWIDPGASRVYVLLAHRIDPAGDLNRWRRRFHAAAARSRPEVARRRMAASR
jgi:serine-type D-Ala-D-Ala carboxypeptidase